MIVVQALGGLGNQMFQYAVGLSVARRLSTDILVDKTQFQDYKVHSFGLNSLNIDLKFANPKDYVMLEGQGSLVAMLKSHVKRLKSKKPLLHVFRERGFTYNTHIQDIQDNTYITGYFQSEKYFLIHRAELIKAFSPKKISGKASSMAKKIDKAINSTSLHVRRGDYISNPNANKHHGVKGIDYYAAALKKVNKLNGQCTIFVFSDDIEWCKANLPLNGTRAVWVDSNNTAIEDIYLMSLCQNNIIANSSFSWWGAWLNDTPNKTVVAPRTWFEGAAHDTRDLIPEAWIRL